MSLGISGYSHLKDNEKPVHSDWSLHIFLKNRYIHVYGFLSATKAVLHSTFLCWVSDLSYRIAHSEPEATRVPTSSRRRRMKEAGCCCSFSRRSQASCILALSLSIRGMCIRQALRPGFSLGGTVNGATDAGACASRLQIQSV